MKDEIAEAAEEIVFKLYANRDDAASRSILPIISEACRKAREKQSEDANKLLNKAFNVITEFGGICSDTRAGWWLKDYDEYLYRLSALSEPKKEEV